MAETQNSKQNVQAPQAGQTVIVNAIPGQDIVLEAAFDQAEVKLDSGNVIFEFANGGQVVLDFSDIGTAQAPNVVMPDGTILNMEEFLASLGESDVEPAAGPEGGGEGSGGVGEYRDDAGNLIGSVDKLGGLDPREFSSITVAALDADNINPLPSAGFVSAAADEDGLVREWGVTPYTGNDDEADGDHPATAAFVKGFLNYDFGGDGPADALPFTWNLADLPSVTSQGNTVLYEVTPNGQTLNAYWEFEYERPIKYEDGPEIARAYQFETETVVKKVLVFSLELTNLETGEYLFTLYRPLDHPEINTEDDIVYNFSFTVTDGSGDPATGGLNLIIDDDSPVGSGKTITRTVDEDDILTDLSTGTSPNDGAWRDGSYTGNPFNGKDSGPANIWGSLKSLVSFGADGPGKNGFSLSEDLQKLYDQGLTSQDEPLGYRLVNGGMTLQAYVSGGQGGEDDLPAYSQSMVQDPGQGSNDRVVFELWLDSAGNYKFKLFDQLDHFGENDESLTIDLSSAIVATDGDGDFIILESGFVINVTDDAPKLVGKPIIESVAENDIDTPWSEGTSPNDGKKWYYDGKSWQYDGSYTGEPGSGEPGPAYVFGSLGTIVRFGADDAGVFKFTDDAESQLEALGLRSMQSYKGLKAVPLEYEIAQDGDFWVLTATEPDINPLKKVDTSNPVFELRLNSITGQYEFRLYDELVHTGDQHEVIKIDFGSMIQAIDADGDALVLDGAFFIKIVDDRPIAVNDERVINEDTPGWVGGNVTDNDISGADETLSFTGWQSTAAKYGSFIGLPDGTYWYNLDNDRVQYLDDGEKLQETFKYSIKDTDGDISTATLTIVIEGRNDRPSISVYTGNKWNADDVVDEAALSFGSNPPSNDEYAYGKFKVADPDGLDDIKSVTINGNTFLIGNLVSQVVNGDSGILTITNYNSATGVAEYEYKLTKATTDKPGKIEFDNFTLTTFDGDLTSEPAYIKIEITDDQPIARNDTDQVAFVESDEGFERVADGNVLTGVGTTSGPAGADTPGADLPAVVYSIGFDANNSGFVGSSERVEVGVSGASIDGKYGTLTINPDGSYTYVADPEKLPEPTTTTVTDGSGVTVKAFQLGESIFNAAGKYNTADGETDDVTSGGNFPAKGVDSGADDNALSVPDQVNYAGSESEALAFEFDGPVSSATITVSNLFNNERGGEAARWHAFDANGVRIATGIISDNSPLSVYANSTSVEWASNNVGTFTVSDIGTFTTLVIEALPYSNDGFATNDDSDFFATVVSYDALPDNGTAYSDVFKYWIKDADGDFSSAYLTINGVEPNPVGEFVNQAPVAEDNSYTLEGYSLEGNIITDDDDGAGAASGRDWDADTPVGNLSVHSISWNDGTGPQTVELDGAPKTVDLQFGELTINPDGSYTYELNEGANGKTDSFTYMLEDVHGAVSSAPALVTFNLPDFADPMFIVGSASGDDVRSDAAYIVGTGPGVIVGDSNNDILVGDPGGSTVLPGAVANIVLVLDNSGSMRGESLASLKSAVVNALNGLKNSQAQDVKVHIVRFGETAQTVGTYHITQGGVDNLGILATALAAVNSLAANLGATNYEAALVKANEWITGGSPLENADINKLVFVSDGEPNRALNNSGGVTVGLSSSVAMQHVLGTFPGGWTYDDGWYYYGKDEVSEVALIETDNDGIGGPEQAFTIEAVGINVGDPSNALNLLSQLEGSGGAATNVTTPAQLSAVIGELTGAVVVNDAAGDDVLQGGAGNDLIFGDALNTDDVPGVTLPDGSGWLAFAELETGTVAGFETWTRADTLDYIKNNHVALSEESGRKGGHDYIDGGAGNDTIYGQEGNDTISGGAGDDLMSGGSGQNVFKYVEGDLDDVVNGDTITDFDYQKDQLDLAELLDGAMDSNLSQFLRVANYEVLDASTAKVSLQVDADGSVGGESFTNLATITISNLDAGTDHTNVLDHMLDNDALKIG